MNFNKTILLLFIGMALISCSKDDEATPECQPRPLGITIEVLDATTDENAFSTGRLDAANLEITDAQGNALQFAIIDQANRALLNITLPNTEGNQKVNFKFRNAQNVSLSLVVQKSSQGGCNQLYIFEITKDGAPVEFVENTGIVILRVATFSS